jgi:hypothetical protein
MCIACEMAFLDMLEALSPQERERIMREEAARFSCDAPPPASPPVKPAEGERKP